MRKSSTKRKVNIRRFLRGKNDQWGSNSTITVWLDVSKDEEYRRKGEKEIIPKRGAIDAGFDMRDCSESISLDFSASRKQRHMIQQHGVIKGIIRDLQRLDDEYEKAIIELRDEGYL